MSEYGNSKQRPLYVYILLALVGIGASALLGYWAGGLAGGFSSQDILTGAEETPPGAEEAALEAPEPVVWPEPPVYVCLGPGAPDALRAKVQQAAAEMSGEDGRPVRFHRFIAEAPLPWPEHGVSTDTALATIRAIVDGCADAEIVLSVPLDPPAVWLEAHPESVMVIGGEKQPYVSVASKAWREAVRTGLEALITAVKNDPAGAQVRGCILRCLKDGQWVHPGGYDRSEANIAAFREWLTARYETIEAFRAAWRDKELAMETAPIPKEVLSGDSHTVFHKFPAERPNVDYLDYASENTAETLALFASQIKATAGHDARVHAPYGLTFGPATNCAGHAALNELLNSEVDGFVSPAAYDGYDIDQSGGILGAVHSALHHGKSWLILDDSLMNPTAASGDDAAAKTLRQRLDHVFAVAATQGMGLGWRIPIDTPEFPNEAAWSTLKSLKAMYSPIVEAKPVDGLDPFGRPESRLMTVVLGETGRFHQVCDTEINNDLLRTLPANVLRAGVPMQICLLSDLLAGTVPATPCYLFLNTFHIPAASRDVLHTMLRETGATAIWLYAPGYCNGEANAAANITATVQMEVKPYDKPVPSGSVVTLGGVWIPTGTEFGNGAAWSPSFYIEDDDVNVIATHSGSGKASVAIAFLGDDEGEKGWTSVYCAEPVMPVGLLREILRTLEIYQYVRSAPPESEDFYYFGRNSLAIHATTGGERIIDLGGVYNAQDLLDPAVGWPEKRVMTVPIEAGQTRIFKIMPVPLADDAPPGDAESSAPEEAPEEVPAV